MNQPDEGDSFPALAGNRPTPAGNFPTDTGDVPTPAALRPPAIRCRVLAAGAAPTDAVHQPGFSPQKSLLLKHHIFAIFFAVLIFH